MKLLEEVKKANERKKAKLLSISGDELEVALAWLKSEVSIYQVQKVINKSKGSTDWWLIVRVRELYRKGIIK